MSILISIELGKLWYYRCDVIVFVDELLLPFSDLLNSKTPFKPIYFLFAEAHWVFTKIIREHVKVGLILGPIGGFLFFLALF